jgi:hypothetical protein
MVFFHTKIVLWQNSIMKEACTKQCKWIRMHKALLVSCAVIPVHCFYEAGDFGTLKRG